MTGTFKIGEAAELLNLKTYVLRFWETEFPDLVPLRTQKGQRLYTREHVALLERVRFLLHERGLTIEGARRILDEEKQRGVTYAFGIPGALPQPDPWPTDPAAGSVPHAPSRATRLPVYKDGVLCPPGEHNAVAPPVDHDDHAAPGSGFAPAGPTDAGIVPQPPEQGPRHDEARTCPAFSPGVSPGGIPGQCGLPGIDRPERLITGPCVTFDSAPGPWPGAGLCCGPSCGPNCGLGCGPHSGPDGGPNSELDSKDAGGYFPDARRHPAGLYSGSYPETSSCPGIRADTAHEPYAGPQDRRMLPLFAVAKAAYLAGKASGGAEEAPFGQGPGPFIGGGNFIAAGTDAVYSSASSGPAKTGADDWRSIAAELAAIARLLKKA